MGSSIMSLQDTINNCLCQLDILNESLLKLSSNLKGQSFQNRRKKDSQFYCGECGKQVSCQSVLKRHMEMHLKYEKYGCDLCPARYKMFDGLYQHYIRNHHKKIGRNDGLRFEK